MRLSFTKLGRNLDANYGPPDLATLVLPVILMTINKQIKVILTTNKTKNTKRKIQNQKGFYIIFYIISQPKSGRSVSKCWCAIVTFPCVSMQLLYHAQGYQRYRDID